MQTTSPLSRRNRLIAALCLLFFVLYCSVGVCTNLFASSISSSTPSPVVMNGDMIDHSMHAGMLSDQPLKQGALAHCDGQPKSCDWSLNPVVDPVDDAAPDMSFFLQYLLTGVVLLFSALQIAGHRLSYGYSLLWERCRCSGAPRLHLQQAVFLN